LRFSARFIESQRAYHDGDPQPNNALWSTIDPVSLFAARGLGATGTGDVTRTFGLVASWFSDLRSYDWELLASDVIGDCAYTVAIERYTASREAAQWLQLNSGLRMCIGVRTDSGGLCTATPTSSNHPNNQQRHEHTRQASATSLDFFSVERGPSLEEVGAQRSEQGASDGDQAHENGAHRSDIGAAAGLDQFTCCAKTRPN